MTRRWYAVFVALLVGVLAAAGCGGGDDDDAAASGSTDETTATDETSDETTATDETTAEDGGELPQFSSDFNRVCTTQVGFPGATPLAAGAGPHKIILFQQTDDDYYQSGDFPDEWEVTEDSDFEDNSELAAIELVACAALDEERPTGINCDFEGDDGDTTTLELVDTSWTVTVYNATTGEAILTSPVETNTTDCPFIASIEEGDTTELITPTADDYTNAVKDAVTPAG